MQITKKGPNVPFTRVHLFRNPYIIGKLPMSVSYIPEGQPHVSPYLIVKKPEKVIEFAQKVFGAEVQEALSADGKAVNHCEIRIQDSVIMCGRSQIGQSPMPAMLYVYTDDCDGAFNRAVEAGADPVMEPADQFYGDRNAGVICESGITWWIAQHVEDVSEEELKRRHEANKG